MESMDSGKTISTSEEATRKLNERKKIGNKIIIMSMVSLRTMSTRKIKRTKSIRP